MTNNKPKTTLDQYISRIFFAMSCFVLMGFGVYHLAHDPNIATGDIMTGFVVMVVISSVLGFVFFMGDNS